MPRRATQPTNEAAPETARKQAPKPNQSVRMDSANYDRWGIWCKVNGMTLEESILFLLREHPIDAKRLAGWMTGRGPKD